MNILFVSECYPDEKNPQYCIYLEQQAKALIEKGHSVQIMLPKICEGIGSEIKETEYNGIKILNVSIKKNKVFKFFSVYSLKDTLKNFNWGKYDCVSLHIITNELCFRICNICKNKTLIVNHFHGLNVWKDYYFKSGFIYKLFWLFNYLLKRIYIQKTTAIVGVSNKVCETVKEKIKNKPIFTVYNGVDSQRFIQKTEYNENEIFTVLCVANLIKIKGHDYLLEAIEKLKNTGKNVKLQLIGIGPEEKRLKEKCLTLGIGDNVEFLGTKDYDTVARYMKNSDMFVMPSYFEALGCVYLESMCCGTLTCGCFGTGADEIINDKIDGLLVNQKSSEDIYNAIKFAIDNPDKAKEIAENGINRAKLFSWEASAESLINVYEQIRKG